MGILEDYPPEAAEETENYQSWISRKLRGVEMKQEGGSRSRGGVEIKPPLEFCFQLQTHFG